MTSLFFDLIVSIMTTLSRQNMAIFESFGGLKGQYTITYVIALCDSMSQESRPARAKQPEEEWCIMALVRGFALTGRYCPPPFPVGVAYSYICPDPFRVV